MRKYGNEPRIVRRFACIVVALSPTPIETTAFLGRAPRSAWTQLPLLLYGACGPIRPPALAPNAELGTSSTMLRTFLSAKKSGAGKLKVAEGSQGIEEKWLAPPAREEAVTAALCDLRGPGPLRPALLSTMISATLARALRHAAPSARNSVAVWSPPAERETRTLYAISAMASPSVSIMSSYIGVGRKRLGGGGLFRLKQGGRTDARS